MLCACLLVSAAAFGGEGTTEFSGRWEVTTKYPGGSFVAGLDLKSDSGHYVGRSGYLVPDGIFYKYSGSIERGVLHLQVLAPDDKTMVGDLLLTARAGALSGKGS